jgi:hypothetical protein
MDEDNLLNLSPLLKAIRERDAYLKENPELQEFQDQIDVGISRCDTPQEKMEMLQVYMLRSVDKIKEQLLVLEGSSRNLKLDFTYAHLLNQLSERI